MHKGETQQSETAVKSANIGSAALEQSQDKLQTEVDSINASSETAEATLRSILEMGEKAKTFLVEIQTLASQASTSKTAVVDAQAVIAAKSDHIENARKHADDVRAELDRSLTAATQQVTEAEGLKTRAQNVSDIAATLLSSIQTSKGLVDADAAAIKVSCETSQTSVVELQSLSDKAEMVEQNIANYEKQLANLEAQCAAQLKTITDLLPGATSAGLAYAFDARRKTFLSPTNRWQWIFVGSVVLIALLAFSGMFHAYQDNVVLSYDELGRMWLARLPVVGALMWLALHASRESALAKRLEEDYGYKAAISASFLGFNKKMAEIGAEVETGSPLAQLCSDTLATIANPPGRIYEKHALIVSPSNELKETVKAITPSP